ncbi:MAG: hypothetical protein V1760_01665 [Candidatus Peregrinibacteria bacterium]
MPNRTMYSVSGGEKHSSYRAMHRLEGQVGTHGFGRDREGPVTKDVYELTLVGRTGVTFVLRGSKEGSAKIMPGTNVALHSLQEFPGPDATSARHYILGVEIMDQQGELIVLMRSGTGYILGGPTTDESGKPDTILIPAE